MRIAAFEFADGARFQKGAVQDANIVGQHIELLRKEQHGELTPEDILKDARNRNSPLHSFFEWDDGLAAEQHRLQQARGLIRAVVAVYLPTEETEKQVVVRAKAYTHINEPTVPHYRETTHALSQTKTRKMVLQRAWRELQAWRERYKDLAEFADLITVIDDVQKHLPKSAAQ